MFLLQAHPQNTNENLRLVSTVISTRAADACVFKENALYASAIPSLAFMSIVGLKQRNSHGGTKVPGCPECLKNAFFCTQQNATKPQAQVWGASFLTVRRLSAGVIFLLPKVIEMFGPDCLLCHRYEWIGANEVRAVGLRWALGGAARAAVLLHLLPQLSQLRLQAARRYKTPKRKHYSVIF